MNYVAINVYPLNNSRGCRLHDDVISHPETSLIFLGEVSFNKNLVGKQLVVETAQTNGLTQFLLKAYDIQNYLLEILEVDSKLRAAMIL